MCAKGAPGGRFCITDKEAKPDAYPRGEDTHTVVENKECKVLEQRRGCIPKDRSTNDARL